MTAHGQAEVDAILAEAERRANQAVAEEGRPAAKFPAKAGYLTARVGDLARDLFRERRYRHQAEKERDRLLQVEEAALALMEEWERLRLMPETERVLRDLPERVEELGETLETD
jgi:hypothetical protein